VKFRPCIDLRQGKVVQIVGGTLSDKGESQPETNFQTDRSPAEFAERYRSDGLKGGHVIALGPGNEQAARRALGAFPGGMHYGGGVSLENAAAYLSAGASHVIVTSYVFTEGRIDFARLEKLVSEVGKERLVLDLSCRRRDGAYWVVTDRWQKFTETKVDAATLSGLSSYCSEYLVHAVDVEGRRCGIQEDLVDLLAACSPMPVTYAGGARALEDLNRVEEIGEGRVDLTIGSALDIFGGAVPYAEALDWHRRRNA